MTPDRPGTGDREQWRAARRRAARLHHPDLGGSTEAFVDALSAVDEAFGLLQGETGRLGTPVGAVQVRRTRRGRLELWRRRGRRHLLLRRRRSHRRVR
ncbi:hypothetical protein ASD62_10380 [Phycicoccus sp. Root563]|uniref:hypothetical protein n=1 Tax=unclassified Phycicoccus TaxID=2637926 RepID=UPI00070383B5|nr:MULTISPECIES: hypothetical protein [unclassified Phycicoccus]KQU65220.1 hypothetical protein ASC58_17090 [Phycicoccus sp. Root101]KQZ89652.1 hypothetical protein ASD62_10380 [Phycicoccus sp. Root563]